MATLHKPTALWPSSSKAWVTMPTGLVKSTNQAPGFARAAISSANSSTNGAEGLGQPPGAGRFLPQAAVTERERLVDVTRRLAADAQLDHDEVGSLEGGVAIGCGREPALPPPCAQNALGQSTDDVATLLVGIQQDEVVDDHAVLVVAQAVHQFGGVGAATTRDGHLDPHVGQRTIRP